MSQPTPAAPRRLTREALALEAGVSPEYVDELVSIGAIERDDEDRYAADAVRGVRLAWAPRPASCSSWRTLGPPLEADGIVLADAGAATLKGVTDPVAVLRVVR
jgi:hypothetical protein